MANRHRDDRRRVAANRQGLHESHDQDWTERDTDEGDDQHHHHHHHHHHGSEGDRSDRDYERLAEDAHSRTHGENEQSRQHGDTSDRHGGTANHREGVRGGDDRGGHSTGEGGRHHPGRETEREYGSRREQRGRSETEHANPQSGSQRGSHREQGISGRTTGQRGTSTHHSDPSDSTFREGTTGEPEHRHGGARGTSERDRRYGSRRGHGSERHTDQRRSSQ